MAWPLLAAMYLRGGVGLGLNEILIGDAVVVVLYVVIKIRQRRRAR